MAAVVYQRHTTTHRSLGWEYVAAQPPTSRRLTSCTRRGWRQRVVSGGNTERLLELVSDTGANRESRLVRTACAAVKHYRRQQNCITYFTAAKSRACSTRSTSEGNG